MTETLDDVAEQALEEMHYRENEGDFGNNHDVSIPCQLRFTEPTEQRTDRFHEALEVHNFTALDTDPARTMSGREGGPDLPYYDGEVCHSDHYNRIRVLVFRGGLIRLFPCDGHVPDADELAKLLHAITIAWKSDIEHHPIEREDDDA